MKRSKKAVQAIRKKTVHQKLMEVNWPLERKF
jgi:hypothetical protein